MNSMPLWVGMDVHKETICVAVMPHDAKVPRAPITIRNRPEDLRRFFGKLKKEGELRTVYEAGACGYEVHRQLTKMQIACDVIAPTLIPVRVGDRVKTDPRDATKLVRLHRAGELTAIRVPTADQESLRDLVRCREDLREDVIRERQRLIKFLLRHGRVFDGGKKHWTGPHFAWLRKQTWQDSLQKTVFDEYLARLESTLERIKTVDQEIARVAETKPYKDIVGRLRCLRGVDTLVAVSVIAELYDLKRFARPSELMAFVGLVPSEHSSGGKQQRGSITKTGNGHVRRLLIQAAWHYSRPPRLRSLIMSRRWAGQPAAVVAHAQKAQERLHRRFHKLTSRGKPSQLAVTAVARELCGFLWAVGVAA